jgi:hypothetical protein
MTSVAQAWQDALAAEYAAVFGYGVLGPALRANESAGLARTSQDAHRELAAGTAARLTAAGQAPDPPEADYPLPFPVDDEQSAQRYATALEVAAASAWRYLVAVAADPNVNRADGADREGVDTGQLPLIRAAAQAALTASALRAMRWRQLTAPANATVPFPGIDA